MKWVLILTVFNANPEGVVDVSRIGEYPTKETCIWEGGLLQNTLIRLGKKSTLDGGLPNTPIGFECIKVGYDMSADVRGGDKSTTEDLFELLNPHAKRD